MGITPVDSVQPPPLEDELLADELPLPDDDEDPEPLDEDEAFEELDELVLVEVVSLPPEPESSPQAAIIAVPESTVNSPANFMKRVIVRVFLPRPEPKPCSKN